MNYTEIEMEGMKEILRDKEEYIKKLEEENRLLKNEIAWLKDHTKYNGITKEYYIDGTMTATEAKLRLQQAEDNQNYVSNLEEENRKLKKENNELKEKIEKMKEGEQEFIELMKNYIISHNEEE